MPKFDIAGHRRIWFLLSLALIIPGFICMGVRGFNFGIDFTGGTIIDLRFEQPVTLSDVRSSLAKYDPACGGGVGHRVLRERHDPHD